MARRFLALLLAVTLCFMVATGCKGGGGDGSDSEYPVTVGDVTFKSQPQKVVVLCDSIADIILACSLENTLIGRSDECTQEEMAVLPSVGAKDSPDTDKIVSLNADLVLADNALSDSAKQKLENSGVTVIKLAPALTRAGMQELYKTIGSVLAGQSTGGTRAKSALDSIFSTFDDLVATLESDSPATMTVCYIIDEEFNTISDSSFGNELIRYTNAINVAESADVSFMDNIKLANPQYIFCNTGLKEIIAEDERFADVTAVKEDNVYEMNYSYMTRQGQTMIDAVIFMAKILYPHLATTSSSDESEVESGEASSGTASAAENPIPADMTLEYGDENDYVLEMQKRLDELGYMFYEPTGYYGASTKQAVSDFQFYNYDNLTDGVTGVADPETIALLYSSKALKRPEPLR